MKVENILAQDINAAGDKASRMMQLVSACLQIKLYLPGL